MLVAVRHNRTSFNEDGKEKLRGWLDIGLSKEGLEQSLDTATKLNNLKLNFDSFNSSPLKRAVQTSNSIKDEIDKDFNKTDKLKDWNTGIFTGQPIEKVLSKIHDYMNSPDKSIPEGESFNHFYDRAYPFLKSLIESDETNLIVTHNRDITLLKALCANDGKSPDMNILKRKGPIEPGGIIMIDPDWSLSIVYDPKESTIGAS